MSTLMQIIAWVRDALKATLRYSPQKEGKKDRKKADAPHEEARWFELH